MISYARGALVLVELGPVIGHEQDKKRPCVVLSDLQQINRYYPYPLYTIVPFTKTGYLTGALVPTILARKGGLVNDSTALIVQIRSVDPYRVAKQIGTLNNAEMSILMKGLILHFGMSAI